MYRSIQYIVHYFSFSFIIFWYESVVLFPLSEEQYELALQFILYDFKICHPKAKKTQIIMCLEAQIDYINIGL